MKKILLFFTALSALPSAFAQEIFIAGRSFSLVTMLPAVFMAIMILFFLFIFIKDNVDSIKKLIPKFRMPQRKREKGTVEFDYLKEIRTLEKKASRISDSEALRDLSQISKHFFRDKLNLHYEFTATELKEALESKKRMGWVSYYNKLSDLKYSGHEFSKEDVAELIKDFRKIAQLREKKLEKKSSFITRLSSLLGKTRKEKARRERRKIIFFAKLKKEYIYSKIAFFIKVKDEEKKILDKVKNYLAKHKEEEATRSVNRLITEGIGLLDKDISKAQENYAKAIALYYQLSIEDEASLGRDLANFYNKIEEAINKKRAYHLNKVTERIEKLKTGYTLPEKEKFLLKKLEKVKNDFWSSLMHVKFRSNKARKKEIKKFELLLTSHAKQLSKLAGSMERKGAGYLSDAEKGFVKDIRSLSDYLKRKGTSGWQDIRLAEAGLLNKIKRLSKGVKTKRDGELTALHKKISLPTIKAKFPVKIKGQEIKPSLMIRDIKVPTKTPMLKFTRIESPRIVLREHKPGVPIRLNKLKAVKGLIEEEGQIINKIKHTENIKTSGYFIYLPPAQRHIDKYSWEVEAEKIRAYRTKEMRNLLHEEKRLISEMSKLKNGR